MILILINTGLADVAYLVMEITTCSGSRHHKGSAELGASTGANGISSNGSQRRQLKMASMAVGKKRRREYAAQSQDVARNEGRGQNGWQYRAWVWVAGGEDFRCDVSDTEGRAGGGGQGGGAGGGGRGGQGGSTKPGCGCQAGRTSGVMLVLNEEMKGGKL